MAGEKKSEQLPNVDNPVEDSGELITPVPVDYLNAANPDLYATPGAEKLG